MLTLHLVITHFTYVWKEKEVLAFIYDGLYFRPTSITHTATSSYYGLVKLSDSTSSKASNTASSVKAVKSAYDLANTANTTASTAQSALDTHAADSTVHVTADEKSAWNAKVDATELAKKQNKVTYGTTDLTAGSSVLATGELYFVYE